jgi:transposase
MAPSCQELEPPGIPARFTPDTDEILASELTTTADGDASLVGPLLDQISDPIASVTADGAYDGDPVYRVIAQRDPAAAVIIPPRSTAVPSNTAETAPTQRDQHLQKIQERGRRGWQKAVNYGRRSLGEVAMMRYKTVIGRRLHARLCQRKRLRPRPLARSSTS